MFRNECVSGDWALRRMVSENVSSSGGGLVVCVGMNICILEVFLYLILREYII